MNPWNETIYGVSDQFDRAEPRTMTETRKHTQTLTMIFNASHKQTKRPSDINYTKERDKRKPWIQNSNPEPKVQKAEALKGY